MDAKNMIAKRVAREIHQGNVVNLGIGVPTLVANHVSEGIEVVFQSENGILGSGPAPIPGQENPNLTNASGFPITAVPGASYFDSADSFGIIRGGHVDITVLGALQVDKEGNLASWIVPGRKVSGMGGAMDLVVGAKKVIIAMEHTIKGKPKILEKCAYPLTAVKIVNMIVTEMGVIQVADQGLVLTEVAPGFSVEDVKSATEAELIISPGLIIMEEVE